MNSTNTLSKARPIGRILRFILGVFFVTEVWAVYVAVTTEGTIIRLNWALGLLAFYNVLHLIVLRVTPKINRIIGAILALVPLLAVFFIGYGGAAATGTLTYLALALFAAAIRGDGGSGVMSVPAVFTGKHTHLACLLFSPIDWCESQFK